MKIQFCGASSGVTGSCHLITTEKHKILLDCGQFQGGKAQEALNYEEFPFDPAEIEYMVLSHAHIDHCGRIPLLIKRGFKMCIRDRRRRDILSLFSRRKTGRAAC